MESPDKRLGEENAGEFHGRQQQLVRVHKLHVGEKSAQSNQYDGESWSVGRMLHLHKFVHHLTMADTSEAK